MGTLVSFGNGKKKGLSDSTPGGTQALPTSRVGNIAAAGAGGGKVDASKTPKLTPKKK